MRTSPIGIKKIATREGTILHGYLDSKGLLTIGVGHLVKPGEPYTLNGKITQAESDRLLAEDLRKAESAVNAVKVPLTQNQFDALVSFVVNIGVGGFEKSTVLKRLNASDYNGAARAMMNWVKPPEITGRRKSEQAQFLTPYKTSTAALPASKPDHDTEVPTVTSGDNPTAGRPSIDFTGGAAIVHPVGDAPPSLVAVQTPVVEVEQVKPEQESVIDTTITKWSARFVAVPTALLSFLGGVWAWMTNSPTELVMTLIIAGAVVAVIYFVGKMFVSALDKARQDRLQAAREQRAHEIQKLTLESAMHKDLNTVRVVPQPLANSDNPANEVANA